MSLAGLSVVCALPTGATLGEGVTVSTAGNVMNIVGARLNNVVKWESFSVADGETVDFGDKNFLNYVIGDYRSFIDGIIKGEGDIFLINPNGILFGKNARVNVGGMYLSTRVIEDERVFDNFAAEGISPLGGAPLDDVVNMGQLAANRIEVEGKDIIFLNDADVSASAVHLKADGEIRIGFDVGEVKTEPDVTDHTLTAAEYAVCQYSPGYVVGKIPSLSDKYSYNVTPISYYLVRSPAELQNIRNNTEANYMLADDIDFSTVDASSWNGGKGFLPIAGIGIVIAGQNQRGFSGRFDGLGFTVKNLDIRVENSDRVGLFAEIIGSAVVENMKLFGGNVTAIVNDAAPAGVESVYVGSLAGALSVNNDNVSTLRRILNENSVSVEQATNTVPVYVGGLAGNGNGFIEECQNAADLSATVEGKLYLGGIMGNLSGHSTASVAFKNVLNTGNIAATVNGNNENKTANLGGLIGGMAEQGNGKATITDSINAGNMAVNGGNDPRRLNLGGIVGNVNSDDKRKPSTLTLERVINFGKVSASIDEENETAKLSLGGVAGIVDKEKGILKEKKDGSGNVTVYYVLIDENGENLYDGETAFFTDAKGVSREEFFRDSLTENEIFSGWSISESYDKSKTWLFDKEASFPVLNAFVVEPILPITTETTETTEDNIPSTPAVPQSPASSNSDESSSSSSSGVNIQPSGFSVITAGPAEKRTTIEITETEITETAPKREDESESVDDVDEIVAVDSVEDEKNSVVDTPTKEITVDESVIDVTFSDEDDIGDKSNEINGVVENEGISPTDAPADELIDVAKEEMDSRRDISPPFDVMFGKDNKPVLIVRDGKDEYEDENERRVR